MKKSLIALAALSATAAFAQSSVTIGGLLDVGIQSQKFGNSQTVTTLGSGIHGASRVWFTGTEDLGGGLSANWRLEMQPSFQNGSTNADLFNRGAWAGLKGGFGELRMGRQGTNAIGTVCTIDQLGCYSGFYGGGLLFSGQGGPGATGSALFAANPTRGGTQATSTLGGNFYANSTAAGVDSTRYVKQVRYTLPELTAGLEINAAYAFGNSNAAAGGTDGDSMGFDVTYKNGPLALVGSYQKAGAEAGADKKGELTTAGGTYNLGVASVGLGFQQEKASGTGVAFTKGESVGVTVLFPMGAATPYVKYGEHKYSGGTLGSVTNAKVSNIGARYALSKRTYTYVDYVSNGAAVAATSTSAQKSMASVGLVHTF
jgi:predicted porin